MNPLDFAQATLTSYIVTIVIAESFIMKSLRRLFREVVSELFPWWLVKRFLRYDSTPNPLDTNPHPSERCIFSDEKETEWQEGHDYAGYDFIGCRLCVGAWVTLCLSIWWIPLAWTLAVWGAAWFLTRQER